jgi:4-hydroxy-tetrahydrodipicolinate reductase
MINICFAGITGWTAPPILAAIDAAEDLTLTSGVSRSAAGQGAVYATAAEALAATAADVPSGTARDLAETLSQVREPARALPLADLEGPVEARGAEVGGTRVHSVRLPGFVVSTEVVFAGPGERLVMRHDAGLTPAPYVAGTLLAVRRVAEAVGVRRGLDSLLFEG